MKIRIIFLFLLFTAVIFADHYPRHKNIDVQHYVFRITINDTTNVIKAETSVEIKFKKPGVKEFYLDFANKNSQSGKYGMTVTSIKNEQTEVSFKQSDNKLIIYMNSSSKEGGLRTYDIYYSGIPQDGLIISKNKFGDRTFFGDNWPNRAHYWLPTIDHPYDKASCEFIITAPDEYQVIANGTLVEETNLGNGFKLTHWKEDSPLPTKVMVFAAARFAVQYLPSYKCIPIETWVYPQDKEKGFYDFEPAEKIIKLYTKLIGPFPYDKLADVESTTKYGGMENATNIFYGEKEVTGKRRNETSVAHEIAHQWFGDCVSEEDWDHIWLSEGFATFFQNYFTGWEFGNDSLITKLKRDKKLILNYYEEKPNSPIVDTTITDLNDLLNINSYQKGAWVLRMLEHVLGDKVFWKGIHNYYETYKNKNALTKNFESAMEKSSGKNLSWFFNEWLYKPGQPYLSGNWNYNDKKLVVKLNQIQKESLTFKMPVDLWIYHKSKSGSETYSAKKMEVDKREDTFTYSINTKPDSVVLDPGTWVLMQSRFGEKIN
jgi:aminopeptidase N